MRRTQESTVAFMQNDTATTISIITSIFKLDGRLCRQRRGPLCDVVSESTPPTSAEWDPYPSSSSRWYETRYQRTRPVL